MNKNLGATIREKAYKLSGLVLVEVATQEQE
jgi:hypothetical protein